MTDWRKGFDIARPMNRRECKKFIEEQGWNWRILEGPHTDAFDSLIVWKNKPKWRRHPNTSRMTIDGNRKITSLHFRQAVAALRVNLMGY